MPQSRCIVVLGVHGSGTSAVAGVLHHLGVSMGRRIVGPGLQTNERGHYEDTRIRRWLNNLGRGESDDEKANADIAAYLFERRTSEPVWGIKDPRLCSKLDLIHRELGDYRVICTERNPLASARSAAVKWDKEDIDQIQKTQDTMRECRSFALEYLRPPTLWVNFNNLTDKPAFYVNRICNFAFDGLEAPGQEKIQEAVAFIDPSMNNRREDNP